MERTPDPRPILAIDRGEVVGSPFPFVARQPFLDPEFYRRLRAEFPLRERFDRVSHERGGRTGRDLYRGDPELDSFLATAPTWRAFHDYVDSQVFVDQIMGLFGAHLPALGCRVDPARAQHTHYVEPREALVETSSAQRALASVLPPLRQSKSPSPNLLYSRFDIEQSGIGYEKSVHCDRPNRVVSLVLYFCDADEIGMKGGNLRIHEHLRRKEPQHYERHPRDEDTRVVKTLRPKENLGVLFLCCNNSYHSATRVEELKTFREFVYINLSSHAPKIW